jgi:hypothetical protein
MISTSVVGRRLCRGTLRGGVATCHTTVNHKVGTVDEAAFVAGKEKNGLSLLNSLTEAACGEVNLAAVALGFVVSEPVLEKGSAVGVSISYKFYIGLNVLQWRRAQSVESVAISSMHHSQFPRHGQNCALARRVRKLRCGTAYQRYNTCCVNHTRLFLVVFFETQHCVLTPKPHTLDVDCLRQVPDLLGSVDRIVVLSVHDSGIVEKYVQTSP